jgi:hypothetical protein
MKRTLLSLLLVGISVIGFGCLPGLQKKKPLTPEEAAAARRTIVAWLECEECTDGELEAVVKLGEVAVPSLAATVREGPSPAKLEELRRHLEANYRRLKDYQSTHRDTVVPMTSREYVNTYMGNYIALVRSRAAIALGKIGGPEAKKALQSAQRMELRRDAAEVVEQSLGQLER